MNQQRLNQRKPRRRRERGIGLLEVLITFAIIAIITAMAVPQLIASRRLYRATGIMREVMSQMRYARQQAMSRRQAVSFRYDDATKQITIINHHERDMIDSSDTNHDARNVTFNPATNAMVKLPNNPGASANTVADETIRTVSLASSGLQTGELSYGTPSGNPVVPTTLGDGSTMTTISTTSNQFTVTFQPDGSVVDSNGNPANFAFFLYDNKAGRSAAAAISVLGAGGRVKLWRYTENGNSYVE